MITTPLPISGDYIEATCSPDSHYQRIRGTVTGFRNGFFQVSADQVIDKWGMSGGKFEEHPTSCALSVRADRVVEIIRAAA